ncbi:MAG: hypothetical protein ACI3VY_07820 [Faecousia sp.]
MAQSWKQDNAYEDILYLPHHVSQTRPRMSRMDRAAQFSPFQALTGLDSAMQETERQTTMKIELDENEKAVLDEKLRILQARILDNPEVFIVFYRPDAYKDGGSYCEVSGSLRRIDTVQRKLLLNDGTAIPLDDIYSVDLEHF